MIQLETALYACIGLIVYYSIFQLFSDLIRAGMKTNTKNRLISQLRADYNVNIRTFQKNNNLLGFAWFNSIWINENLFRNKKSLLFTFYHEYYHITHGHKKKVLLMRSILALQPLALTVVKWYIFVPLFLLCAYCIMLVQNKFEDQANDYAKNMLANDYVPKKGESGNK